MRLAPALVLATLLAAGPAVAQDATTPAAPAEQAPAAPAEPAPATPPTPLPDLADIGPNADRDFWCALAYSLTARAGQIGGNEELANGEAQKSQVLFASLVTAMKANNLAEEQFNALTSLYTIRLLDPFAVPQHTREECEAAVPEARAAIEAAQPATPPAEPGAPADSAAPATPADPAAPADPATPDAPAAGAPEADAPGTQAPAAN